MKSHLALLFSLCLLLVGCKDEASDPEAARVAAVGTLDAELGVVQTQAAQQTLVAAGNSAQAQLDALATENTELQSQGTQTAAAQATLSAIDPQLIAPEGAICRFGPDAGFTRAGEIPAGDAVRVYGRSTNGEWWQVASPDEEDETCWVYWENDLDFLGEVFNLPFVEGPSLPTNTAAPTRPPGISINFIFENNCDGVDYAIIAVNNTGPETYESAIVALRDPAAGVQITQADGNNEFLPTRVSCPKGNSTLGPGQSAFLAVPTTGAASGITIRVNVRLCTENGFGGNCVSSNTTFTH